MKCVAELRIFYLSGECVISPCVATCSVHLQTCMCKPVCIFIGRKHPFFLMEKEREMYRSCEEIQLMPCHYINWKGRILPVCFWTVPGIGHYFSFFFFFSPYNTERDLFFSLVGL